MPVHGAGLDGGWKRFAPAVDAPYGTPRKIWTAPSVVPRSRPASVVTTGPVSTRVCPSRYVPLRARNARRSIDDIRSPARRVEPVQEARMTPLETVQTIYAAFGRGDVPAIIDLVSDDVEWE